MSYVRGPAAASTNNAHNQLFLHELVVTLENINKNIRGSKAQRGA